LESAVGGARRRVAEKRGSSAPWWCANGEQGEKAREEKKWGSESGFKLSMVAGAANSDLEGEGGKIREQRPEPKLYLFILPHYLKNLTTGLWLDSLTKD